MRSAAAALFNDIPFLGELSSDWTLWFHHHPQKTAEQEAVIPGQNFGSPEGQSQYICACSGSDVFGNNPDIRLGSTEAINWPVNEQKKAEGQKSFLLKMSLIAVVLWFYRGHLCSDNASFIATDTAPVQVCAGDRRDGRSAARLTPEAERGKPVPSVCCCLACPSQPTVSCLTSW